MAVKAENRVMGWMQEGHEPVRARGTVRLAQYKQAFPKNLPVTVRDESGEYRPLMLRCGRPLMCHEVLPERADLCLDSEGHLLSQADFEARYADYLSAFPYPYGSDISAEPIPGVVGWVKEIPDPFSESKGPVEIGFDPKLNEDFKPKARFGPNGETEEEWLRESSKNSTDVAAALKTLADNQALLTQFLMKQTGETAVPVVEAPAPISIPEATEAAGKSDREIAPCGKDIKRGFLKNHQRFCNADECGGPGENSAPVGDAA